MEGNLTFLFVNSMLIKSLINLFSLFSMVRSSSLTTNASIITEKSIDMEESETTYNYTTMPISINEETDQQCFFEIKLVYIVKEERSYVAT